MSAIYYDPNDFEIDADFCLDASLVRLEGCVALEILARWSEWEIDHDHAEMARTSTVRGWKRLPARIQPHPAGAIRRGQA